MKDKLKSMLNAYAKEILHANSANQCFFDMSYSNDRNAEWEKVYKIAPAFFGLARHGLQTEAFLIISKLYEPDGRADYNLYKLINFIISNSKSVSGEIYKDINKLMNTYKSELDKKQLIADKFLYIRDKVIAHNGKEHFLEEKNDKTYPDGITFEESKELLNFAGEMVNDISSRLFNYRKHLTYTNGCYETGHDLDNLMQFCIKNM